MKRWVILAVLVMAISGLAGVAARYLPMGGSSIDEPPYPVKPENAGPLPVAVVDEPLKFEFGTRPQKDLIKTSWTIRNKGKADLTLREPQKACSCTSAGYEGGATEVVLKPGESIKVNAVFETRENNGKYYKHMNIPTSDPEHQSIELGVQGLVYPSLVTFPNNERTLAFSTLPNDTEHSSQLALSSPDVPDFKITKITSSRPGLIEAKITPLNDDDKQQVKFETGYKIVATVKPGMPLGEFKEELVIETDHPKQPEMRVTLMGKVVGPITVNPDHVTMPSIERRAGGTSSVDILIRGQRPTKIELVKKPEHVEASVEASDPEHKGTKYRLVVTVPPGTSESKIEGTIELKTDHPQAELVKVPVVVFIGDRAKLSASR